MDENRKAAKKLLFIFQFFEKRFSYVKNNFFCKKNYLFKTKSEAMKKFSLQKKYVFQKKENKKLFFITISSPEREAKKVKIAVDRNPVETSFERWACDLKKG